VIGCGAGFPGDIQPDAKSPFAYFGIVGVDDFNFGEMWQLEKKLSKLAAPDRLETFSGGHEWAPKDAIERALAWLSVLSIKTGSAESNKGFLEEQLKVRLNAAEQLLSNKQYVDADRAFGSIVRDFQGLLDVGAATQKAEELDKSSEVKKERSIEEDLYRRQLREAGQIRMSWLQAPQPDMVQPPRLQAISRLTEFRKAKEQPTDSTDRRLARRILSHLTIESFETAQVSVRDGDYATALANYELVKEIDPKNANVHYEIARMYALKRQKKPALQFLEEAVALGFKDLTRIKADEAFASLADEPRYQKVITGLVTP
jgi:tetratricopeptide (TPR) repeat protein